MAQAAEVSLQQILDLLGGGITVVESESDAADNDVRPGLVASVDGAVNGVDGLRLMGYAVRESAATAAVAAVSIVHGATAAGGDGIIPINLLADESVRDWFGPGGIAVPNGISILVGAGTIDVVTFFRIA